MHWLQGRLKYNSIFTAPGQKKGLLSAKGLLQLLHTGVFTILLFTHGGYLYFSYTLNSIYKKGLMLNFKKYS